LETGGGVDRLGQEAGDEKAMTTKENSVNKVFERGF